MYKRNARPIYIDRKQIRQFVDMLFEAWRGILEDLPQQNKAVMSRSNFEADFALPTVKGEEKKGELRMAGVSVTTGGRRVTNRNGLFAMGAFYSPPFGRDYTHLGVKIKAHPKSSLLMLPFNNKWTPEMILEGYKVPAAIDSWKETVYQNFIHELTHWRDIFSPKVEQEYLLQQLMLKGKRYQIEKSRIPFARYALQSGGTLPIYERGGWQRILDKYSTPAKVAKLKARLGISDKQLATRFVEYNYPIEVRAYMQNIVDEVESTMRGESEERRRFLLGYVRKGELKPLSSQWEEKEPYFTPKTSDYILASVIQRLQEQDLIPDVRAGFKPFSVPEKQTRGRKYKTAVSLPAGVQKRIKDLQDMLREGFITKREYVKMVEEAKAEKKKAPAKKKPAKKKVSRRYSMYFTKRQILELDQWGKLDDMSDLDIYRIMAEQAIDNDGIVNLTSEQLKEAHTKIDSDLSLWDWNPKGFHDGGNMIWVRKIEYPKNFKTGRRVLAAILVKVNDAMKEMIKDEFPVKANPRRRK